VPEAVSATSTGSCFTADRDFFTKRQSVTGLARNSDKIIVSRVTDFGMNESHPPSPTLVDGTLWIVWKPIGFAQYDFAFEEQFPCTHPIFLEREITSIARLGSAQDYARRFREMGEWNIRLINSPEEYQRSSLLPCWYPLISEFTPRSVWFDRIPTVDQVTAAFEFPIFIKGERQTNQHSRSQSIIETREDLCRLLEEWSSETILWWQRLVCREFVRLRPVAKDCGMAIPKSYEFRTFWFRGELVGVGRYWVSENYTITQRGLEQISEIGRVVAARLRVPFLVIDFAETCDGTWLVIECNDGQDSGYAGVTAREMWTKVIEQLRR